MGADLHSAILGPGGHAGRRRSWCASRGAVPAACARGVAGPRGVLEAQSPPTLWNLGRSPIRRRSSAAGRSFATPNHRPPSALRSPTGHRPSLRQGLPNLSKEEVRGQVVVAHKLDQVVSRVLLPVAPEIAQEPAGPGRPKPLLVVLFAEEF